MVSVDRTSMPYRDATYSVKTQAELRALLVWLEDRQQRGAFLPARAVEALTDVVERWEANDATETTFDEAEMGGSPLLSDKPLYATEWGVVYEAECPGCGLSLHWEACHPPIPMVVYRWLNTDDEQSFTECPNCDAALPEGDLTKVGAQS